MEQEGETIYEYFVNLKTMQVRQPPSVTIATSTMTPPSSIRLTCWPGPRRCLLWLLLQWEQWRPPTWTYPQSEKLDFSNLLVPTMDSTRALFLLQVRPQAVWRGG